MLENSQKNTFAGISFLIKFQPGNLCELFKNTYFKEHLRTAVSKIQVRWFLSDKVASLMAWGPLKVVERDSSTGILLLILGNFFFQFFSLFAVIVGIFSFLQISEVCSNLSGVVGELGEGIHKSIDSSVVMKIRWKLHCEVVTIHVPTYAFQYLEKWKKRKN